MATIERFRLVMTYGAQSSRAAVQPYSPSMDSGGVLDPAYSILGMTMTAAAGDEDVSTLQSGYMRGLGSSDMTGWEPATGARLWAGAFGKPTTTRPAKGAVICIGTYMGGGMVDVNVRLIPALGELSFVKRETLAEYDVLIWDATEGAFVPRQLDHGQDFAGLTDDDHPQYAMRRWSWLVGG